MEDTIKLAKAVTQLAVGTSVTFTVSNALKNLVPVASRSQQIRLAIGAYSLGSMAALKSQDWSDERFDKTVEVARKIKSKIDETRK